MKKIHSDTGKGEGGLAQKNRQVLGVLTAVGSPNGPEKCDPACRKLLMKKD